MTRKTAARAIIGFVGLTEDVLSFFRTAEWISKHWPDALKPLIEPQIALAVSIAAIIGIVRIGGSDKKEANPQKGGDGPNINAENVHIGSLTYRTSSGIVNAPPNPPAPRLKDERLPHLVPVYTDNRWFNVPEQDIQFPGIAAAFRNDVTAPLSEALNITTHLTYRHRESGGTININEALWIERDQNSMNIYAGKTCHLALAVQMPDSRPPLFVAADVAYDPQFGSWVNTRSHALAHGHYDLEIEIKADNYRAFFKCEGELGDNRNVWSTPVEVHKAHMRAPA